MQRFKEATCRAKVDVLLQNHMLMDPIQDKLVKMTARKPGEPNPFVVGAAQYQKVLGVMDGCTRVNIERRQAKSFHCGLAPLFNSLCGRSRPNRSSSRQSTHTAIGAELR